MGRTKRKVKYRGIQGSRRFVLQPYVLDDKEHHGNGIGQRCGHSGSSHIQMKYKNENRVQYHIEDTAEHHAGTGLFRMVLTPKQMAQRQAHHGWHAAQYHHPEKIFFCIAIGIRAGSQKIKQRYAREPGAQGKEKRHRRSSPNAEYGHIFDVLVVLRPHHPGNQAAAAQAEQVPQRREQIEPGRYQGNGGHHQQVAQLSHKKVSARL